MSQREGSMTEAIQMMIYLGNNNGGDLQVLAHMDLLDLEILINNKHILTSQISILKISSLLMRKF